MLVKAGDTFQVSCPPGEKIQVTAGEKIPPGDKAVVKVLKVENSQVTLGPLRSGDFSFSLPCSQSWPVTEVTVQPLAPQDQAKRFDPLGADPMPLSIMFFIALAGSLLLMVLAFVFFRRRKHVHREKVVVKVKASPRELLTKNLNFLRANVRTPEAHHFHDLYKQLRRFVEAELSLNTRSLTSGEFLGTFRALALQQSANQNFVSLLEYLLKTADDVRFTGKSMKDDVWTDYLNKVQSVMTLITPPAPPGTKKKEKA